MKHINWSWVGITAFVVMTLWMVDRESEREFQRDMRRIECGTTDGGAP